MGMLGTRCAGVWVCWCLGVFFFSVHTCLSLSACLGCLPACLVCLPACLECRPALLAWVPAGLACLGARPRLNVSTTRGTVPLTMVTAQHDRIPSQPYGRFLESKAPQVGGSRMAGARQAQGRVGLRVAPTGLYFCGRSLRHRQIHEHQVRIGRTWTPSEMIPDVFGLLGPARRNGL